MAEWIDVNERLPQNPMRCLVYTRRGDVSGHGIAYYGGYYDGFSVLFGTVTHWMPLPEPPRTPKERGADNG